MTDFEYFKSTITPEWLADNALCTFASGSDQTDCDKCPFKNELLCYDVIFRMYILNKEREEETK